MSAAADNTGSPILRTVPGQSGGPTKPDIRPSIKLGVDLERIITNAVGALAKDTRVYQRSGQLVGVVAVLDGPETDGATARVQRAPGATVIRTILLPTLMERLATNADWLRWDARLKGGGGWVPCLPPKHAVAGVLARGEWPGVRPLVSVVTSPCLKPDGTILQADGYDRDTATLFRPCEKYVEVPDLPTLADAKGALDTLREIVCDFPFARPEHESAWLAGVLTMLARPAIAGPCPMFAVDATTRGTGKSRLVDAAVRLATGTDAARTSMPEDDDEMRKRITALMLEGDAAVCLDNITKAITLPSLDAVLTSTVWKDRLLGVNANVAPPARAVWWATGNNLELGGDLSRRALHIRLESSLENPEERDGFKHPDLIGWVNKERHFLVACALTILRAYRISGEVCDVGLWGSFEDWSRIVPAALVWAGAANPMLARATQDPALDDEKRSLTILIDGLIKLCPYAAPDAPMVPISARDLISILYPDRDPHDAPSQPDGYNSLRDAIEQETRCMPGRKPEARRLGKWLQRVRGRVVNGWRVERVEGPSHTACWRATPPRNGTA